jgi:Pvc16 N-terminal domain
MSGYSAISDASTTLLELLKAEMDNLVAQDHISLSSPAELQQDTTPRLGLFLYQVIENHHLKNRQPEPVTADRLRVPPLALDAFYLLTAYAQTRESEHQILGRAIQIFNDHSIIRGSVLRGSLAGSAEEIKIVLHTLSLDDTNKLWNMFGNRPYKLSVAYRVSLALIDSTREIEAARMTQRVGRYGTVQPG